MHGPALMQDQVEGLRRRGVAAEYLASTRSDAERCAILADLQRPAHCIKLSLLFITPELVGSSSAVGGEHLESSATSKVVLSLPCR